MEKKKENFKPTAVTIVMIFLAIVALLTWVVPTSVVVTDEAGTSQIIYNAASDEDGNVIENAGTSLVGLWDYFTAPIEGFIDAADIATSILISGGLDCNPESCRCNGRRYRCASQKI